MWCYGFVEISAYLEGVNMPKVYVHCSIYIEICHEICQVWCSCIADMYA